jgi:hypothetical protein
MLCAMSTSGARSPTGEERATSHLILTNNVDSRPKEFPKSSAYAADSDDEESTVGKMPPSDSEDE